MVKKYKNPLRKRFLRELKRDMGKYIVIFLFMTLTIGFISGFLVADNSLKHTYDESFEKYNVEDGNFELMYKAEDELINQIEEMDVTIYENFSKEFNVLDENTKIRIFGERTEINKSCLMSGKMPKADGEIAIDRMFAENNKISVGDSIEINGMEFNITGFVALSDYSTMFEDNTDMMFDSINFGVAVVTKGQFETLPDDNIHYVYSWKNKDKGLSEPEAKDLADNIGKTLIMNGVSVKSLVPVSENQAIQFTGEDMGSDKGMMVTMLYVIMVILAFIFGVTIMNTIENESLQIGTLRAMGYTRAELLRHYLTLPVAVTLVSGAIGNILGYTFFKYVTVNLYYGSYSLTKYETLWNGEAFLTTTVVPCIIMLVINVFVLWKKLQLSPLKFLRHDLKAKKMRHAVRLPDFSFRTRFRLRILLQNKANYILMLIAVLFANVLLIFGSIMTPLLEHYGDTVEEQIFCEHQYILKQPVATTLESAEKYAVSNLMLENEDSEVTVYGIDSGSDYIKGIDTEKKGNGVYLSHGILEKFGYSVGDKIKLKGKYSEDTYEFKIIGTYRYSASMAVFMGREQYADIFGLEEGYFNGYFSDEEITDIDGSYIVSDITIDDMTKIVRQLKKSMGSMMPMFQAFSVILAALIFYLLSKIVIEKNAISISMVKILGYNGREIGSFYIIATTAAALLSIIISIPAGELVMRFLFRIIVKEINGWVDYYMAPFIYIKTLIFGILAYGVSAFLQYRKISAIKLEKVLKTME